MTIKPPYLVIKSADPYDNRHQPAMDIQQAQVPNWPAQMATVMAEKWGMVAAMPDGEDTAGRAKLAPASPAQVVERACTTAELLCAEFERRGWLIDLPSPEEQQAIYERQREERLAAKEES